ncbi:MAG: type II secretion system protein J [Cyanobacteriota bacterium]
MNRCRARRRRWSEGGFSLPEALMGLAAGLTLTVVLVQGLVAATQSGERLGLLLRERQMARRTLALLRSELALAQSWQVGTAAAAECALGGRTPVLALEVGGRWITYSVGEAPSRIWRGQVLMRCGPAYGLSGELSGGAAQNRVLIDGLVSEGVEVESQGLGVIRLNLRRAFRQRSGNDLDMTTSVVAMVPPNPSQTP